MFFRCKDYDDILFTKANPGFESLFFSKKHHSFKSGISRFELQN